MIRLIYVIAISLPIVLYYVFKSNYVTRHMDRYSEAQRYSMVQRMVEIMKKNGRIKTLVFGEDNLPADGGYVMYSNHQGKYDALGILSAHKRPCSFVIDAQRAKLPFAREFTDLLEAIRLDKTNMRNQVKQITSVISQVKEGRRFIIFPEGGYKDHKLDNIIEDFMPGAFNCSLKSKTPIIPVVLRDSYKVFGINSLRKITTEVHFLKPILYEEYAEMNTRQIAELVKSRMEECLG